MCYDRAIKGASWIAIACPAVSSNRGIGQATKVIDQASKVRTARQVHERAPDRIPAFQFIASMPALIATYVIGTGGRPRSRRKLFAAIELAVDALLLT